MKLSGPSAWLFVALSAVTATACKTPGTQSSAVKDDVGGGGGDVASTPYPGPPLPEEEAAGNWNDFCVGTQTDAASIPGPNYNNADVKSAAAMLTRIRPYSYSLYGQIAMQYKNTPVAKPDGVSDSAHTFLTYLCGEFRDRPTMVAAKIRWINHTNYMPPGKQGQIDPSRDVWPQLTAEAYEPFIHFSDAYYNAKLQRLDGKYDFGTKTGIDKPVPALSVCETKFILDRKSTRLNSSHIPLSRMPSSA